MDQLAIWIIAPLIMLVISWANDRHDTEDQVAYSTASVCDRESECCLEQTGELERDGRIWVRTPYEAMPVDPAMLRFDSRAPDLAIIDRSDAESLGLTCRAVLHVPRYRYRDPIVDQTDPLYWHWD